MWSLVYAWRENVWRWHQLLEDELASVRYVTTSGTGAMGCGLYIQAVGTRGAGTSCQRMYWPLVAGQQCVSYTLLLAC